MLKIFGTIGKNLNIPNESLHFTENISGKFYSIYLSGVYDRNRCIIDNKYFTIILCGYLNENQSIPVKTIEKLYKKHGKSNFCKYLNGSFNLIVVDKQNKDICVCNDKYASRPLFVNQTNIQFIFGSEVKLVYPFIENKLSINWKAWGQYLTFRFLISDNTFHKDINFLPNATQISFALIKNNLTIKKSKYWDYSEIKIDRNSTFDKKVREGVRLFKTVFKELGLLVQSDNTLVALSGGYDSRSIVAGLTSYSKARFDTVTTTHPCGDETPIVKRLTSKLKLSSIFVNRPTNLYRRFFVKKAELCDSLTQEHIWIMPLLEMSKNYENYIDGMAGDIIMRSTRVRPIHVKKHNDIQFLAKLFKKQFGFNYQWLSDYIDPKIWKEIKYNEDWTIKELKQVVNNENRMVIFLMKNRIKNGIAVVPSNLIGNSYKNVYTPFIDDRLVNFGLSIPHIYKFKFIYRAIIDKAFPSIKTIVSTSDEDLKKLEQYDNRIMEFEQNPRELISDYNSMSQDDIKYMFKLLRTVKFPSFINRVKFVNDMKKYPQIHKVNTILDLALWSESLNL